MLKVNRNYIYLTRGDTASFQIDLLDARGQLYEWQEGDRLIFRLKESETSKPVLITKMLISADEPLIISEADTVNLKFDIYRYELELVTAGGEHHTVVENSPFEIGPELENHDPEPEPVDVGGDP